MAGCKIYFLQGDILGTGTEDLQAIASAGLTDDHIAELSPLSTLKASRYRYDTTSTATHDGVEVVQPADNAGAGRWLRIESVLDPSEDEPGTIEPWPTETPKTGWLECDGSAISRTTYADLFGVIGDTFGVGDGVNTFNLPDFRGEFLRGWDHGAGNDPDAAGRADSGDGTTGDHVGTKQACEIEEHDHNYSARNSTTGGGQNRSGSADGYNYSLSTQVAGGNETRPRNVNVMWIIKY